MTPIATDSARETKQTPNGSWFYGRGKLSTAATVAILALHPGTAICQSAGSFGAKTPSSASATSQSQKKTPATASKDSSTSNIPPSRFVGESDFDAYIKSLSSQLSMNGRATDPFGQQQDPNAKPIIKSSVAKTTKRVAQVQSTPFPDIINQIRVNTIIPGAKQFLIGSRTYKQGGTMSIIHRGKTVLVHILSVNARQIELRNSETGETATLKLEALPVGMTPGTKGIIAPGMAPDVQDAPINLDVGTP